MPFDLATAVETKEAPQVIPTKSFDLASAQEINPEPTKIPLSFSSVLRSALKFSPYEQFKTFMDGMNIVKKEGVIDLENKMQEREAEIVNQGVGRQLEGPMAGALALGVGEAGLGVVSAVKAGESVLPSAVRLGSIAAGVGGFSVADHFFSARRWVEENAPNTPPVLKDFIEILDFAAKGALIGGGAHFGEKAILDRLDNLNLPKSVALTPDEVSKIKGDQATTKALNITPEQATASEASGLPVQVSVNDFIKLATSPDYQQARLLLTDQKSTPNLPAVGKASPEYLGEINDKIQEASKNLELLRQADKHLGMPNEVAQAERELKGLLDLQKELFKQAEADRGPGLQTAVEIAMDKNKSVEGGFKRTVPSDQSEPVVSKEEPLPVAPKSEPVAGEGIASQELPKPLSAEGEKGTVGIANKIKQQLVDEGVVNKGDLKDLSKYDKITHEEQASKAGKLINSSLDDARSILRGEKPLPPDVKSTAFVAKMLEYLKKNPSAEIAHELANSPHLRASSEGAQEMGLAKLLTPDSAAKHLADIAKAKENFAGGKAKVEKIRNNSIKKVKAEMQKVNLPKEELNWDKFLDEVVC